MQECMVKITFSEFVTFVYFFIQMLSSHTCAVSTDWQQLFQALCTVLGSFTAVCQNPTIFMQMYTAHSYQSPGTSHYYCLPVSFCIDLQYLFFKKCNGLVPTYCSDKLPKSDLSCSSSCFGQKYVVRQIIVLLF